MPTDNVVPIDADAARVLARRSVRFRWFVAASVLVWLGMLVPVLILTPLPPVVPFLVLAALLVLSEHRFVLFGDETSMSGSIIVAVASVFVFADTSPFAGPMLIASLGGLYFPHLRHRQFGKIVINATSMCLGAVAACIVVAITPEGLATTFGTRLSIATLAAIAYWCANNVAISAYVANVDGGSFKAISKVLLSSDTAILLWAIAAALATEIVARPTLQYLSVGAVAVAHGIWATRTRDWDSTAQAKLADLLHTTLWLIALGVVLASEPTSALVAVVLLAFLFDASHYGPSAPSSPIPVPLIVLSAAFVPSSLVAALTVVVVVALTIAVRLSPLSFRIASQIGACTAAALVLRIGVGSTNSVDSTATIGIVTVVVFVVPRALLAVRVSALRRQLGVNLAVGVMWPGSVDAIAAGACTLAVVALDTSLVIGMLAVIATFVGIRAFAAAPSATHHETAAPVFR